MSNFQNSKVPPTGGSHLPTTSKLVELVASALSFNNYITYNKAKAWGLIKPMSHRSAQQPMSHRSAIPFAALSRTSCEVREVPLAGSCVAANGALHSTTFVGAGDQRRRNSKTDRLGPS